MKKSVRHYKRKSSGNPVAGIFFLLIIGLCGFFGWRLLPLISKVHGSKFDRVNILVSGGQNVLISYNVLGKSFVVVKIPGNLYVTGLIHGYGNYQSASIYQVGELDKRGGETVQGSMQEYLGVPVDNYFITDREVKDVKTFFLSPDFLVQPKSNMGFIDRLTLLANVSNVRFDRIRTVDLGENASTLVLADGSQTLSLDPAEVDKILQGSLVENQIQDENFRVEIINSTDLNGLGARAVRLLTNIGLSVINVESNTQRLDTCTIFATEDSIKSLTVARIANIYKCQVSKKPTEDRAAVTVKLGRNYASFLTQ
ncbi:LytR C-terminal domain-containing protein [Candidatus Microgenomates bacterium]|nr:LytR C-terminal domain-containing protein [Candidatus Microgenomates bacterium]